VLADGSVPPFRQKGGTDRGSVNDWDRYGLAPPFRQKGALAWMLQRFVLHWADTTDSSRGDASLDALRIGAVIGQG
jgi:hypothetical protein